MAEIGKIEPYKELTLRGSIKDDGSFEEWQHIERVIKQAEEQFMKAQIAQDVEKMIKDFNEKGLGDEAIQDKTQNQKDL